MIWLLMWLAVLLLLMWYNFDGFVNILMGKRSVSDKVLLVLLLIGGYLLPACFILWKVWVGICSLYY